MKKILALSFITLSMAVMALPKGFVNPNNFKGTDAEKAQVIKYIEERTKSDMKMIGADDPSMLRMMETENLKSFKSLTEVEDKKLLDKMIQKYCGIVDMCTYTNLKRMYDVNEKASKKSLSW